jgi:hypothetical protein
VAREPDLIYLADARLIVQRNLVLASIPDPKWLEILKAGGGQFAALACATGVFLVLQHLGWFGILPDWVFPTVTFAFLSFAFLALAALIKAIDQSSGVREWLLYLVEKRRAQKQVRDYIPCMTTKEREIIGYLLSKNQKMFTADEDGGYAATLMSRRIIVIAALRGQMIRGSRVPMAIPDHVWEVLAKHRDQFPYKPPPRGQVEPEPWRINWMVR